MDRLIYFRIVSSKEQLAVFCLKALCTKPDLDK